MGLTLTLNPETKPARARPVRLGFVPLCDCAPLVMAQTLGLFDKHGLPVQLSRQIGWATLRDKLCCGELDAVHALAPTALAVSLGLGAPPTDVVSGLVLNLHGNAITLSQRLWPGARDAQALRTTLRHRPNPMVLGIPFLYSAHHFLVRAWLKSLGL